MAPSLRRRDPVRVILSRISKSLDVDLQPSIQNSRSLNVFDSIMRFSSLHPTFAF